MQKIQEFLLDRDKNITEINKELMSFIDGFVSESNFIKLLKWISFKTKISINSLQSDSRIYTFRQFINSEGRFKKNFQLKYLLYDSIKFLLVFFYIKFFSRKVKNTVNCELIVDDISPYTKPERFEKLNELCDAIFISSTKLNKFYKTFLFKKKYTNCINSSKVCNGYLFFLNLYFKIFYCSLLTGTNLFPLIMRLLLTYLKYETVFSYVKSKFLIQERHYGTSEIKNEIFHKHGGKLTSAIQKNILQVNGPGMYIHSDVLFTLGTKTAEFCAHLGGKVKFIVPVGSLFMERDFFNRKEKNNFKSYDLLVFASNHEGTAHSGYNSYFSDYYLNFQWIQKFCEEFPNFKIAIKLKKINEHKELIKIFSTTKNIEFLTDTENNWTDSYFLGAKAKALCTWSSTLGFEFIGFGKECYFLDPGARNIGFLPNSNYIKSAKVINFEEFKKKIIDLIENNSNNEMLKNKENFCMYSDNVSENILKNLRNLENKNL